MTGRPWDDDVDLAWVDPALRGAAERAVDYGIALVGKLAQRDIPKDTGRTARSLTTKRTGTRGAVAFRSSKAVPLHENLNERHRRGGRAKFLETNLAGSAATIRRRAVEEFRAAMTRGGQ